MQKLALFPPSDYAYNWVADFLLDRKHDQIWADTVSGADNLP